MRVANEVIKRERHSIPTVEEMVQEMSGTCHFSKLDLRSGYHQLELDTASREITTFSTTFGFRKHKRLTLGVANASEHDQQTLERKAFYDLQNVRNISDDVITWGKCQREHDFCLEKALQRLLEHGLTLNKEKCLFNLPKITFFGMALSKDGISANETKIHTIKKLKKRGNIAELRIFLGLATYLGSFIPNFADLVDLFTKASMKRTKLGMG